MNYAGMIDISYCQAVANVNWNRLRELGIGVMIRAGQGIYEDNLFRQHYANALAAGVPAGIYFFYQPNMTPTIQVDKFIAIYNSLAVQPKAIAVDVENIAYRDIVTQEYINILPPSPSTHTEWLRTWLVAVEHATGIAPIIYTRQDYWNAWVHRSPEWSHYPLWVASWTAYAPDIRLPADWAEWTIWQYEGGTGRQDGVLGPVDLDYFNGSQAEMESFFGLTSGGNRMAAIYKTTIAQKDRAKVLTFNADQALNAPIAELGIDAVILPMGGMDRWDGSHMITYAEPTFQGRFRQFKAAGIPVIGTFALDAGALLKEQHTKPEIEGQGITGNWVLQRLIDAWHDGPWTWDQVLNKQGKWLSVSAIELGMVGTDGFPKGTQVPDEWQAICFRFVANHLKYLMNNGMAPAVPIVLYTGPWWLALYPNQMAQEITNRKGWLYLRLGQWLYSSTATYATLADLFAFRPSETFKFTAYPDGYFERIVMHEYTGEAQKCRQITDALKNPSAVNLSLWNDTAEEMKKMLGWGEVIPPETGPTIAELQAQLAEWETWWAAAPKGTD